MPDCKESRPILTASMMCADVSSLQSEMSLLEASGIDGLHLDLMDGSFVPNFGMGMQDVDFLISHSILPCDVHMMVREPGRYVATFAKMGARIIYVHAEADANIARTLAAIREQGVQPGIALNPGTSVASVEAVLPIVDYVLVMTVNPGFAGQKWLPFVDKKIDKLISVREQYGYKLVIDGNCSPKNIERAYSAGADGFVLGTAGLFGHGSYDATVSNLRKRLAESAGVKRSDFETVPIG